MMKVAGRSIPTDNPAAERSRETVLRVARNEIEALRRAIVRGDFAIALISANELRRALADARRHGDGGELALLEAYGLRVLAEAPSIERSALREAIDGRSRTAWDREASRWRLSRGVIASEPVDDRPTSELDRHGLGMLGSLGSEAEPVAEWYPIEMERAS